MKKLAYRYWSKNIPIFWVANLKTKHGDWGYSTNSKDAISLSPYWQKMFAKDCRNAGVKSVFISIKDE